MPQSSFSNEKEITVADLYPELSPKEQTEAKEAWLRYLRVVRRIFEYICAEKPEILTELKRKAMLRKKKNLDI